MVTCPQVGLVCFLGSRRLWPEGRGCRIVGGAVDV